MYILLFVYSVSSTLLLILMIIRIRNTDDTYAPTMRVAQSGMQILNHTFKNKLSTMSMLLNSIKGKSRDDIGDELVVLEQSINHLEGMVDKIKNRTGQLSFYEQTYSIIDIIEQAIIQVNPRENISIRINKNVGGQLKCDNNIMGEVFHCIIQNAAESIPDDKEGIIDIYIDKMVPGHWLSLCIKDNGCGMPKHILKQIAEPYFSTKSNAKNFGLGMSFCYNVMKTTNSGIKIRSKEGIGTIIILSFNPSKVKAYPHGVDTYD